MSKLSALKDTLPIVGQAISAFVKHPFVRGAGKAAVRAGQIGGAVTQFTQQSSIYSRVFIDAGIVNEIVIPNLMRTLHSYYAAQILAAFQLQRMVEDKRSVQDYMRLVQDGSNTRASSYAENLNIGMAGMESFLGNYLGEAGMEAIHLAKRRKQEALPAVIEPKTQEPEKPYVKYDVGQVSSVDVSKNRIGPMGELFEVTLTNPENKEVAIKAPLFIQMRPSVIDHVAAPRFIDMNVDPGLWKRWTQLTTGEISFLKDFLFKRDMLKRQLSVLKDPQTADAYKEFVKTVAAKDRWAMSEMALPEKATISTNLANSVMIFSEDTVALAKADSGVDLHNERDRKNYFKNAYAMIIVIVDPLHQRVTMYFNGVNGELDCSYNEFKPKDDKFDPKDFVAAVSAFATNSLGRMR